MVYVFLLISFDKRIQNDAEMRDAK